MDIGKSFSYPFEDKEWVSKLGLGAVISLVPIVNFAMTGYMVGILRNMMNHAEEPLPNWDDFGQKFMDGLMLVLAGLVYALPVILLSCLPLSILSIPAILSGNQDTKNISDAFATAGGVTFAGLACLFAIYGLALSVIFPAIYVLYSREGTFASCFRLREAFDLIGKNAGSYFTAWGMSIVAGLVVGLVAAVVNLVLGWIPCFGWIVSIVISLGIGVYLVTIYSHLFGQFAQQALGPAPQIEANQPV